MGLYSTIYVAYKIPMEEKNIEEIKTKYRAKECCIFYSEDFLYLYIYSQNNNKFEGFSDDKFKKDKGHVVETYKEMTEFFQKEYPIVLLKEVFYSGNFSHDYEELDFTEEFNKYLL